MQKLFNSRKFEHNESFKHVLEGKLKSDGFDESEFMLIPGDISLTSKEFARDNPGFKISLLYMDLDLNIPTYDTLNNLWNNITKGGIIMLLLGKTAI